MKSSSKPLAKQRPILVCALAAKLLGHSRVAADKSLSAQQITAAFPAFNALELEYALSELTEKLLVTQKGMDDRAKYALTERGRLSRVSVG